MLALIFVAAAIIYFVWPLGRKEENKAGVVYTAMGGAELPVVYPTARDGSWRRYSATGRSWLSRPNVTASWCCRRTAGFPSGSSTEMK